MPSGRVHRRRVHPPGVPRHDRHAADGRARSRAFVADRRPDKRAKLIDRLLDRPEYAALLRQQVGRRPPEQARRQARDTRRAPSRSTTGSARPGSETPVRPVRPRDPRRHRHARDRRRRSMWYRKEKKTDAVRRRHGPGVPRPAAPVRQVPPPPVRGLEPGRLLRLRRLLRRGSKRKNRRRRPARTACKEEVIVSARAGSVSHPKTGKTMAPKGWASEPRRPATTMIRASSWSTGWPRRRTRSSPGRVVNRYWAHFFGRGIVDPLDDIAPDQPAVEPRVARRPGRLVRQVGLRPQGTWSALICDEPDLSALERPERVQPGRQAELRPPLSAAARRRRCCSTRSPR